MRPYIDLGRAPLQDATLKALALHSGEVLNTLEIARSVLGSEDLTERDMAAVRRALRLMARRGRVEDCGRQWRDARRRWVLLENPARNLTADAGARPTIETPVSK